MPEIIGNLHLHTTASDGAGTHDEVASAAARAGLDFIVYTDHNTWVDGVEGWYQDAATGRSILRLMGQEINDQRLDPALNHMLCHFISHDLNGAAAAPQRKMALPLCGHHAEGRIRPVQQPQEVRLRRQQRGRPPAEELGNQVCRLRARGRTGKDAANAAERHVGDLGIGKATRIVAPGRQLARERIAAGIETREGAGGGAVDYGDTRFPGVAAE